MLQTIPPRMCFVLLAILTGGSWTSSYAASGQPILPPELQGEYVMSTIRMHFCAHGWDTCMPSDVRFICCRSNDDQCSNDTEHSMCMEDDQVYFCGYEDAIVCQYEDGSGSCIYSPSRSIQPLCVCEDNGEWPDSDDQTSLIRGSCKRKETTGPPKSTVSGEVIIIAIVLGTILVIVLLVLLVVCLVKRRRNQTPPKKATTNSTNSSVVSSAAPDWRLPDSVSLGPSLGEHEYAVTPMDHKPAHQHDHATNHTYSNVKSNQQQRGGLSRFAKHKQGSPGMPNLPASGSDRIAPKLPTKDSVQDDEIPDVKTKTKATGVAAIRAVNEVSSEGLTDGEEIIEHTYFECI